MEINDQNLLAIGSRAVDMHVAWLDRNAKRKALRIWLREYRRECGDHFERDHCEHEDAEAFDALRASATAAQSVLAKARNSTRRAIVRAAAEIAKGVAK